ncbi:hypothetical protein [Rothia nasimurium]|nr:hypothetical protein [Rothia nasimurium]
MNWVFVLVAGAGFEPAASGLQDPIFSQVLKTTFLLKKLYAIGALKVEGQ